MAITQSTKLELEHGAFTVAYHVNGTDSCVSLSHGNIKEGSPTIRIHSACLFGESFHGLDCDCAQQLDLTLAEIVRSGNGAVVYQFAEGRGVGLENKIRSMEQQRKQGIDTVESFKRLGFEPDMRNYDTVIQALEDLDTSTHIRVASQNPRKLQALTDAGYTIDEVVRLKVVVTEQNRPELVAKKEKLGYEMGEL